MHIGPNVNIQKCMTIKKNFGLQRTFLFLFSRILARRAKRGDGHFFIRGDGHKGGWSIKGGLIPLCKLWQNKNLLFEMLTTGTKSI